MKKTGAVKFTVCRQYQPSAQKQVDALRLLLSVSPHRLGLLSDREQLTNPVEPMVEPAEESEPAAPEGQAQVEAEDTGEDGSGVMA